MFIVIITLSFPVLCMCGLVGSPGALKPLVGDRTESSWPLVHTYLFFAIFSSFFHYVVICTFFLVCMPTTTIIIIMRMRITLRVYSHRGCPVNQSARNYDIWISGVLLYMRTN